ncbi:MAG: hypothetical protein HOA17_05995 [Candidatus Melainabacteria bacterium]|jgi:hypothetical protein|nr:hypothetical protein [Candidatus Melainabacteria bacterium]
MPSIISQFDPITTAKHLPWSISKYPLCKNPFTQDALDYKSGGVLVDMLERRPAVRNPFEQFINNAPTKEEQRFFDCFKSDKQSRDYNSFRILPSRSNSTKYEVCAVISSELENKDGGIYLQEMLYHFAKDRGVINFVFENPNKVLTYRVDGEKKDDILPVIVQGHRLLGDDMIGKFAKEFPLHPDNEPGNLADRIFSFTDAGIVNRNCGQALALFNADATRKIHPKEIDWLCQQFEDTKGHPVYELHADKTKCRVELNGHSEIVNGQTLRFHGLPHETNDRSVELSREGIFVPVKLDDDGSVKVMKLHEPEGYEGALGGEAKVMNTIDDLSSRAGVLAEAYGFMNNEEAQVT